MVDQLNAFAAEVTRVAREVGTEGKLGGQAQVPGVAGTWKDLTDNVNFMASNLTAQVRNIAEVATAIASGDLSKKITVDVRGEILLLKETLNTMVEQLRSFAAEVTRVAREVGTEGKLGGQAVVPGVAGTWKDLTDNVNLLAANLTTQVRNIAEVTTAVARGDLSRKITVDVKGEILELKNTINTMVDQLNAFAAEVTRVAREVGTEGRLGGQADVPGVAGTWKGLTDNVNVMAANLTEQVRGIVKVVTAVANGDLKQKLTVNAKGEVAALAETINDMTDTLATFADQVTTVAREVGVEGRLGGQANVPGAAGTWKDLTGNVNLLAANLTTQVRAIAEVATAVTKGDLTRSIQVDARGEVAELKDNINTMIDNLRLHHRPQHRAGLAQDQPGALHRHAPGPARPRHRRRSCCSPSWCRWSARTRASSTRWSPTSRPHCACWRATPTRRRTATPSTSTPARASSASAPSTTAASWSPTFPPTRCRWEASSSPRCRAASSSSRSSSRARSRPSSASPRSASSRASHLAFLEQLTASIGIVLNTIEATMQTEGLLKQSQQLAAELQTQQKELQQTNEQLEQKAQQLAEQNVEVERKNQEIEQARRALEEKAAELALTSKYKSEFLANMSHELRTPLNSILILGQQLAENPERNLTGKQVEFARTIHGAGTDLLNLISDILDLSKIESGTVTVDAQEVLFGNLLDATRRTFRHDAESRGLAFEVAARPGGRPQHGHRPQAPAAGAQEPALERLQVHRAGPGAAARQGRRQPAGPAGHPMLGQAADVVAFEVSDTGIGIPLEKQRIIFEAFQQADASTSRKYGGTGLGLAISRELASLLGGEIQLRSTPGVGSAFTLYLPQRYAGIPLTERALEARRRRHHHARGRCRRRPRERRAGGDRGRSRRHRAGRRPRCSSSRTIRTTRASWSTSPATTASRCWRATRGDEALELARQFTPAAVSLDVFLPDMLGWTVLSQLKQDPATRHIPVQMVTLDEDRQHGLARGAFSFVTKPTTTEGLATRCRGSRTTPTPRRRRLLVVEDDAAERMSIAGAARPRRHRHHHRGNRRRGARRCCARAATTAWCSTCGCPTCPGFEVLERAARGRAAARRAGGGVHRQGALARGGRAAPHAGAQRRGQGRRVARAPARRDRALPPPGGRRRCRRASSEMLERLHRSDEDLIGHAPCWWSTTTCATSSRSRACSSGAA